jgi:hypothetical protein
MKVSGKRVLIASKNRSQSAAMSNKIRSGTANISHDELLRAGVDERMEVDPENLQLLFQGASDDEYKGRQYETIPWRLGLLKLERQGSSRAHAPRCPREAIGSQSRRLLSLNLSLCRRILARFPQSRMSHQQRLWFLLESRNSHPQSSPWHIRTLACICGSVSNIAAA